MTQIEKLRTDAIKLAEKLDHRLLPFITKGSLSQSRCMLCGHGVYVSPNPGPHAAAIGGTAIDTRCFPRKK